MATKLERAKRETLDRWEAILESIMDESKDQVASANRIDCGFCKYYEHDCLKCPIGKIEKMDCFGNESYQKLRNNIYSFTEKKFTDCLAVLIYIHQF